MHRIFLLRQNAVKVLKRGQIFTAGTAGRLTTSDTLSMIPELIFLPCCLFVGMEVHAAHASA